jgi:hypothetical protein
MNRAMQWFIRRDAPQPQVLAECDKQSVVDGAMVFRGDFQSRFEEADGWFDYDRAV